MTLLLLVCLVLAVVFTIVSVAPPFNMSAHAFLAAAFLFLWLAFILLLVHLGVFST